MQHVEDAPGYRVLDQAGQGGFAIVYRAYQERLDRVVALKVLSVDRVDQKTMRRFQRELQLTGRLTGHPHVVTVFDTGTTRSGKPYIAMDYFENGSLRDMVRAKGPLPVQDVLRAGVKLAGALAAVHEAGVLHGDIKPQNILISRYGEPAIADFGVARVVDSSEVSAAAHAFTPLHAAPEVLSGQPHSASTDIYSLGSTLYHLLAGQPAFHSPTDPSIAPLMFRVLSNEPPPINRSDVPAPVYSVIMQAMAKAPESRPSSARALAHRLREVQAALGLPVTDLIGSDAGPAPTSATIPRRPAASPATWPGPAHEQTPPTAADEGAGAVNPFAPGGSATNPYAPAAPAPAAHAPGGTATNPYRPGAPGGASPGRTLPWARSRTGPIVTTARAGGGRSRGAASRGGSSSAWPWPSSRWPGAGSPSTSRAGREAATRRSARRRRPRGRSRRRRTSPIRRRSARCGREG
ncbi:protein kinase [Nonomuraea sp. NBC_01738]|uniref:serine/threonine-protein kinase n=1 Tax=Nonomuraea sp. NBC_01738 TaxID=2976003 RepID=UPI002E1254F1|nr:protein kinase [Nonomuraea sp. NBC_01738]